MPDCKVHVYVDKMFFGRGYPKIHKEMDKHVKVLGRGHRRINHNAASAIQIAMRRCPNDPVAIRAALLHVEIDIICSRDPEFRKILEFLAKFGKRKKRRRY